MRSLDEIKVRMAALEAERTAVTLQAQRERAERRRPKRRPHTERTRQRMSRIHYLRQRELALADPDIHPIRKARLEFGDTGLTQKQLADRALISVSHLAQVEAGKRSLTRATARRLARALRTSLRAITEV